MATSLEVINDDDLRRSYSLSRLGGECLEDGWFRYNVRTIVESKVSITMCSLRRQGTKHDIHERMEASVGTKMVVGLLQAVKVESVTE